MKKVQEQRIGKLFTSSFSSAYCSPVRGLICSKDPQKGGRGEVESGNKSSLVPSVSRLILFTFFSFRGEISLPFYCPLSLQIDCQIFSSSASPSHPIPFLPRCFPSQVNQGTFSGPWNTFRNIPEPPLFHLPVFSSILNCDPLLETFSKKVSGAIERQTTFEMGTGEENSPEKLTPFAFAFRVPLLRCGKNEPFPVFFRVAPIFFSLADGT